MYNQHGGNLDAIERDYGIPRNEIVDFSGNINPLGAPLSVQQAIKDNVHLLRTYPDVTYLRLRKAMGAYVGLDSEFIIVGNGSTELISLFIKTVSPKKAVVIAPAYSEYQKELLALGSVVELFPLEEQDSFKLNIDKLLGVLDSSVNLLVLCNPNNPTGTAADRQQLARIFGHCQELGIYVMVDETYAEFADEEVYSIPLLKEYSNVFTIRGTSKFFAVPGLRLGYGCCGSPELLKKLNEKKDPWSVNILSAIGGEAMFGDWEYIQKTRALVLEQKQIMLEELGRIPGLHPYASKSNFILVKLVGTKLDSHEIAAALLKKHLLIRDAASFDFLDESFIRMCILSPEHNSFLLAQLKMLILQ